jgi:hypothetical protein
VNYSGTAGTGGNGGGGNGQPGQGSVATPGTANTGGGGGGGGGRIGYASGVAAAGGSGVVIFTLPLQVVATFSAGVTQTLTRVGENLVYIVTETDPGSTVTIA